jgi:hypothetical protein
LSEEARLPAHLEVSSLIRRTHAAGGFAAVLRKGDPDTGTIIVVINENGANSKAYERMPQLDGCREWSCSKSQNVENPYEFSEYLDRRGLQDPDLWIVELDIAQGERFIGLVTRTG